MLKKNFIDKIFIKNTTTSIQIQTDQFLVYLTVEQKLKDILQQYRAVQNQFKEACNKIEYLQYKNNLLQSSLFELTYIFNNKMFEQNLIHLRQIVNLEETIVRQTKELQNLQNFAVSRVSVQLQPKKDNPITDLNNTHNNLVKSISKANNKLSSKKVSLPIIDQPSCQLKYNNYGGKSYINTSSERQCLELQSSKNEFLQILKQESTSLNSIKTDSKYNIANPQGSHQLHYYIKQEKPQTNRTNKSDKQFTSAKKYKPHKEKQNLCVQKLIKMQAEMKLKNFMSNFQQSAKMRYKLDTTQKLILYPTYETIGSTPIDRSPQRFGSSLRSSMRG